MINNERLKLAIQKEGRLTAETLDFLRKSGLEFDSLKPRLYSSCRNFPLDILYVRDDDIPGYVSEGVVDLGVSGQNMLNELRPKVRKLLNLRFGYCSLVIAVPKESKINNLSELKGSLIATTYPESTKYFLKKKNIEAKIVRISGSVELAPQLGVAQAISDLTSSGSTLALNDLRVLWKIYDSEAVLIACRKISATDKKRSMIEKLLIRFKGVLSARNYKYVTLNAPEKVLPRLLKIMPGLKSPSICRLAKEGWISVQAAVKEDIFWETIERLKKLGATGIIILPIEKAVI